MAHALEVVLTYNPQFECGGAPIPIAKSSDPRLLRMTRERVLWEAQRKAQALDRVDPGVGDLAKAEEEKLKKILDMFLPEEDLSLDEAVYGGAGLRLVEE